MKDTTTTIDEILETIYFHGQTEDSINATGGSMSKDKALRIAKQALLKWHQDKARSYVPEKVDPKDIWKKELGQPVSDAILQAYAYNEAIDQTLKAIEALGLTSKETEE